VGIRFISRRARVETGLACGVVAWAVARGLLACAIIAAADAR